MSTDEGFVLRMDDQAQRARMLTAAGAGLAGFEVWRTRA
jgi:hypothetical protein